MKSYLLFIDVFLAVGLLRFANVNQRLVLVAISSVMAFGNLALTVSIKRNTNNNDIDVSTRLKLFNTLERL